MAEGDEDRTEAATPRRLQRALDSGQAPLSREAAPALVLGSAALVLIAAAPGAASALARDLAELLAGLHAADPGQAARLAGIAAMRAALPFIAAAALAGAAAVLAQTRGRLNMSAIAPGFGRLDVRRNLRRVAGPDALMDFGKSLLKLAAAGAGVWMALSAALPWLGQSLLWEPGTLLGRAAGLIARLLLTVAGVQGALAGLDILRAHRAHARDLRMSRQEIRDELRESDGDPRIKACIRRLRLQRARRRMLSAVPRATVIVTNPTHYAVALAYERGAGGAPRVVAKGIDAMAARIRDAAEAARVPIVANPPLARALWRVDLDREIPAELFKATAEIIAYVWRLRTPSRARPPAA